MNRRVHFVGIGGAGLSAIARILHSQGDLITGSDQVCSPYSAALQEMGINISYGHRAENVSGADFVIASSAVSNTNIELEAAVEMGIPVYRRDAFLPEMLRQYRVVGIAGTHGKTTTTALIAYSLREAGLDPSFIVGGILGNYQTNAGSGKSSLFVIEADEYARTFHAIFPSIAVVTTVEHDHPDCYPTAIEFHQAFQKYVDQTSDAVVLCQDDPGAVQLQVHASRVIRYGFDSQAEWRADNVRTITPGQTAFDVYHDEDYSGTLESSLHGEHNVRNILAAWSVCEVLGVPFDEFRNSLSLYQGVRRRFEILGEAEGITVIDDYAHHPTEIRATLAAAQSAFPGNAVWAIFQPHTYSRLQEFYDGFVNSFDRADAVLVTEVFAAREAVENKVSGRKLASDINHNHVLFAPSFAEAVGYLRKNVISPAIVITLSAGDGNEIGRMLLQELENLREVSDAEH